MTRIVIKIRSTRYIIHQDVILILAFIKKIPNIISFTETKIRSKKSIKLLTFTHIKNNILEGFGVLYFFFIIGLFFLIHNETKIKSAPKESFDCFMTEHKNCFAFNLIYFCSTPLNQSHF